MNNRKNHNSALILATLGVYLGLVLVGATPQVLASAAMTRQFNVKDEIEFKDDLDKKPDGLSSDLRENGDLFANAVADMARELHRLSQQHTFSWDQPRHVTVEDLSFCESDNSPSYLGSGEITPAARKAFEKAAIRIGREYFKTTSSLGIGKYHDGWPIGISLDLNTNHDGLLLNVKFVTKDPAAAKILLKELDRNFSESLRDAGSARKIVCENTKSKVDDVAVILVTNLPRAGLDSLLAANAK